jgi:hypothetical protein
VSRVSRPFQPRLPQSPSFLFRGPFTILRLNFIQTPARASPRLAASRASILE